MAKPLYSVKFTSNFSFQKLSKNLNAVIKDSNLDISTSIAKNTKKNIMDGLKPDLEDSTLIQRQTGQSSFKGHNETETVSFNVKPLNYTGRLLNSIEGSKEGLKIMEYGLQHQKGFTGTHGEVPARPFIAELCDNEQDHQRVEREFVKRMEKAMKK